MKEMFPNVIYIALGGGFGAVVRYMLSYYLLSTLHLQGLYIGTLAINILGAFLFGVFAHTFNSGLLWSLLIIGFCGAFTTFSTFSFESYALIRDGRYLAAGAYILASVSLSIIALWLGSRIAGGE